jgi:hypothetical protein
LEDVIGWSVCCREKRGGKIMVLSAHLSPEIREAYEQMDVHVILDRPFDIQELRSTVDRLAA